MITKTEKYITIKNLFLIFVKIGAILLGGGYVILPILQNEFVDKRHLIEHDEMIDFFALAQSLPGIVAANMSMFIGYKLRGKAGAISAMLGVIFVPFLSIIILASILGVFINNIYVQNIMWGIGVAVIALILITAKEIWQKSKRNLFFYFMFLFSLIALLIFKLSPIKVILIFLVIGVLIKVQQQREVNR